MCMKKLPFCKINVRLYLYIYIYPISTKNFYKRHLYVLKGLDVGTKLIWPYAANKEESDRYCWQQSPSVTWHYSPIRTDPGPERCMATVVPCLLPQESISAWLWFGNKNRQYYQVLHVTCYISIYACTRRPMQST